MVKVCLVHLGICFAALCTVSLAAVPRVEEPSEECGVRGPSEGWPFHAGLYRSERNDTHYYCGATIVSSWHVIGSAHCVQPYSIAALSVRYGVSDLTQREPNNRSRVARLIIHPEYRATDFSHDIALIVLKDEIPIGPLARPICLWPEREDAEDLEGVRGTSVGWGIGLHNVYTPVLQHSQTAVLRQSRCMEVFAGKLFEHNEFFCAVTPVCSGSGGSGFYVEQKDRYYLRGMTTFGIAPKGYYQCGVNTLAGLLRIAPYTGWIRQQMKAYESPETTIVPNPEANR
uniref:Peptidase S1 domain-containing protein n=1 Tax=Anopheles epiroticus TaxID=199890 RepID=A0A182PWH6_9DIPT